MPKNRIRDRCYGAYSVHSVLRAGGLYVTCPRCGGLGMGTLENEHGRFRCTRCGYTVAKARTQYRYRIQNLCESCGRYYNVPILDRRQSFPVLRVPCPYCGHVMPGRVEKTWQPYSWISGDGEIRRGRDPIFGFDLWFLTSFDGKPVWALNREHLAYLIGYLSANLREKAPDNPGLRTQADMLPSFMKTAKNRERLVKRLEKLQQK